MKADIHVLVVSLFDICVLFYLFNAVVVSVVSVSVVRSVVRVVAILLLLSFPSPSLFIPVSVSVSQYAPPCRWVEPSFNIKIYPLTLI